MKDTRNTCPIGRNKVCTLFFTIDYLFFYSFLGVIKQLIPLKRIREFMAYLMSDVYLDVSFPFDTILSVVNIHSKWNVTHTKARDLKNVTHMEARNLK